MQTYVSGVQAARLFKVFQTPKLPANPVRYRQGDPFERFCRKLTHFKGTETRFDMPACNLFPADGSALLKPEPGAGRLNWIHAAVSLQSSICPSSKRENAIVRL